MSVSRNESEGLRHSPEVDEIERLHQSLTRVLGGTLTRDYGLSVAEGNELIEQALCAYLQLTVSTADADAWLISIVCSKAEELYRQRGGGAGAPDAAQASSRAREVLGLVRGLEALPADAQKAVRLRFRDRWSFEDIAAELNVTVKYARHLVAAALKKLR